MLDLGRALAIAWALHAAARARTWLALAVVLLAAYVFALEVASGFTVRSEGPLEPVASLLLVFLGPTGMPRGHLPALPLASLAVRWPVALDLGVALTLAWPARRITRQTLDLPAFSEVVPRLDRAELALVLLAVLTGMAAGVRLLPSLLAGAGM